MTTQIIKRIKPSYETVMGDRIKPIDNKCKHKFTSMCCNEIGRYCECRGVCAKCKQLIIIKNK